MSDLIATIIRASVHRFVGRLGGDPQIRFFESGTCVVNASIAINRPGSKKDDGIPPDWLKLEIWGEKGQQFADQNRKGGLVAVVGRVKSQRWTNNNGEEQVSLVVMVEEWRPVETAAAATAAPAPAPAVAPAAAAAPAPAAFDEPPF